MMVIVQGPGSWPHYGHVMALLGQRFLLATGGNDGKATLVTVEDLFIHNVHCNQLLSLGHFEYILCPVVMPTIHLASSYGLAKHREIAPCLAISTIPTCSTYSSCTLSF
ncbi:hypothetical protein C5167_030613 [Papaver somniferum]|nr:hypothetical protein C5167_030613 [Papaver somniferum]